MCKLQYNHFKKVKDDLVKCSEKYFGRTNNLVDMTPHLAVKQIANRFYFVSRRILCEQSRKVV